MTDLMAMTPDSVAVDLATLEGQARGYLALAKAENTKRAYRADWNAFAAWCGDRGLCALPAEPQTVALFIASLAENAKTSTIQRKISAISQAHQAAGVNTPTHSAAVRGVWSGVRRAKGTSNQGKAALLTDDLRSMLRQTADSMAGTRDRALMLVGFAGAFRRSELVSLDAGDVEFTGNGMVVTLRRSKTDQEGRGQKKGIPHGCQQETCPVRALKAWLDTAGIDDGPIFRPVNRHGQVREQRMTAQSVALIVQKLATAAGLDATKYAGHSLRAGMATQAAIAGASERAIMLQTGHASTGMVRRYIRDGNLFRDNAASSLGL